MTVPNSAPLLGTATVTAAAGVATVAGTVLATGLESFDSVVLVATVAGSAGGTTDVYVQSRHGNSVWVDLAHFPQVAGGGAAGLTTSSCAVYGAANPISA